MKKSATIAALLVFIVLLCSFQSAQEQYQILGWSDKGMHGINKDYSNMALMPPYNTVYAQVIKKGIGTKNPEIVTDIGSVTYEIVGNTTSVGKTNFWDYLKKLFGIEAKPDEGLKGNGLSGKMTLTGNYFVAEGIPLTPFADGDKTNENPYQTVVLKAYDKMGKVVAETKTYLPVSTEINCTSSGCHKSESDIVNKHTRQGGYDQANKPILCASCHPSNIPGVKGAPNVKSLSYIMHDTHAEKAKSCFNCHPGEKFMPGHDIMMTEGIQCQNCHGDLKNLAMTEATGRKPWLDEPSCGASKCHGTDYAEEKGKLYSQSHGHGGLYCSACHGAPHMITPTYEKPTGNAQNIANLGYQGIMKTCTDCHYNTPKSPGPHMILPTQLSVEDESLPTNAKLMGSVSPNPTNGKLRITIALNEGGKTHLDIFDKYGTKKMTVINQRLLPAEYGLDVDVSKFTPGNYYYTLSIAGKNYSQKFTVSKGK